MPDKRDRPVIEISPTMVSAGVAALLRVEDEILGVLCRSSLERLASEVFEEMATADLGRCRAS